MKKSKLTLLCILLVMAITFASVFLVSCDGNDDPTPDKQEAYIDAGLIQQFIYDGNVHNVQATLNHDEATLSYSPQQGYTEIGDYNITISAPETKNYNATSLTVLLKIVSDSKELEDSVTTRWQDLLTDVKDVFSVDNGDVKVNIKAEANITPTKGEVSKFKLDAVGNLDLANTSNNKTNFHVLFGANDNQYGLYIQNGGTYLKLNDDIFFLNNADIMSLLPKNDEASALKDGDSSMIDAIIELLPLALFSSLDDISNTDGVWNLSLDITKIWNKVKLIVLPIVGNNVLSQENIEILDEFFTTNQITFKLVLDFNATNSATAKAELNVATYGAFKANVTAMEIANGAFDKVEGALTQAQMDSAKAINAVNAQIQGTLALVNKSGETYEHLNWKLVADIDPFALAQAIKEAQASADTMSWLNNEDVRKMKVYFSLYHVHQAGDGVECIDAMCPTRAGGMEDTTILDIAFDPQNFGDSKLYLAANLSRIFSAKSLTATLKNLNGLINTMAGSKLTGLLDENFFTAIDLTKTVVSSDSDEPSDPDSDDDKLDIKTIINPIFDLLTSGIQIQNNAITLDMEQTYALLDSILDLNSLIDINLENMIKINATNVKDALFKGLLSPDDEGETEKAFNSISLGITSIEYGNAENFNCKEAITHDPIDASKVRAFGGSKPLSLDGANAKTTGRVFNTKQTYDDYTAAGGIHVTLEELDADVVGKLIEYTYTAMDGQTYTAYTQIIAYEGLDKTKLNTPQTIKAIVLPLDGKGGLFSDLLWSILHSLGSAGLIGGFLPSNITIPFRANVIDMQITLTEVESAEFTLNTPFEDEYFLTPYEYDNTAKLDMSKYLGGTIALKYADGFTRTISANCSSDLLDGKFLINDGNEYTITLSHYSMPNVKKEYKVSAKTPLTPSLIINNEGGLDIRYYGPTEGYKLKAVLKNYQGNEPADSSLYTVKINGTPVDEINIANAEAGSVQIFADKSAITIEHDRRMPKYSSNYLYFSVVKDDVASAEVKSKSSYSKSTLGQEVSAGTLANSIITNLGSQINGMVIYTYWLDSDPNDADARNLKLKFDSNDNKYYMQNEDGSVKVETKVKAYNYNDKDKQNNLLVNGIIPKNVIIENTYDSTKKNAKSLSVAIDFEFTFNDETFKYTKTMQTIYGNRLTTSGIPSKLPTDKTFDGWGIFNGVSEDWKIHEFKLAYKDGNYVLTDSYNGEKLPDIQVVVTATDSNKNPVTLTDGKIPADLSGQKISLTAEFTYDGLAYVYTFASNKTVA
ncbi:MAG: hypothetical protein K2G42_05190 [Clostridia bacterium]|nr:hypothetical protein [Clostridia bacterium]